MSVKEWRQEFWNELIERLGSRDAWYYGFKPWNSGAIEVTTGRPGVSLAFRIRAKQGHVTVTIEDIGRSRCLNFYEQIEVHRSSVDDAMTTPLSWEPSTDDTDTCRIVTYLDHPSGDDRDWWNDLIDRMGDVMDEYRPVFLPIIENLEDLE